SLERQQLPFLTREALCRTLQQRRVELLTITAPEGEPGARPLGERKLVFITARVHPGETPAQFIVHGVIDFLTGNTPRAQALRGNVVFKIVPMLNPDGVVNGNYRCSYLGFDLNRHWLEPSDWAHPEILSVKTLVAKLHEDPSVNLDFFVDIHAHSVGTNSFMYGNNVPDRRNQFVATPCSSGRIPPTSPWVEPGAKTSVAVTAPLQQQSSQSQRTSVKEGDVHPLTRTTLPISAQVAKRPPSAPASASSPPPEQFDTTSGVGDRTARGAGTEVAGKVPDPYGGVASVFPRMLATNAPDFSFARSKFDADPNKEGTGRRALGQLLSPDVLCFTLEVSFYASQRDDGVGLVPYTRGGYIDLGRALASTFFDFYGL
ncbi:unnamed protein product, partial [Scytosiphon promiscuus]